MELKDIRSILGTKRFVLKEMVDKKYHYYLFGLFADVDDETLQFMFDNGFEFVDYAVDDYMYTLSVILVRQPKRKKRVKQP